MREEITMHVVQMVVTIMVSVIGSSGLWAYFQKKLDRNDARTKMLFGLAHDRIISLCERYIEKGSLTHDEYENLYKYLYRPYKDMGGNGTVDRLMEEVRKLPVRTVE